MKTVVVKNIVVIVLVLMCIMVSAQDTCSHILKIDSGLSICISNGALPKAAPHILKKYSDIYDFCYCSSNYYFDWM